MSKKRARGGAAPRDRPAEKRSIVWLGDWQNQESLACAGYTTLSHNPEVMTAVDTIARLIGAMTIHLMQNTPEGDVRIRNGLSNVVDITPNRYMTRSNFIRWIVRTMLLDGNGNAVVMPVTNRGYLEELVPIPPAYVAYVPTGLWDYRIAVNGAQYYPDDLLHFAANPGDLYPWLGTGYRIALATVADNLKQAAATEKGFMSSKWKPSIIVKVDALTPEFANPTGRRKLLEDYAMSGEAGEPWLIPAEQFSVEQVKPLTLSDLALADFVKLDKTTVATILGVPPFVLGVGEFKREEWNSFVQTRVKAIAQIIQQELTRALIVSPKWYLQLNYWSLGRCRPAARRRRPSGRSRSGSSS